jgi:hypothetical protein
MCLLNFSRFLNHCVGEVAAVGRLLYNEQLLQKHVIFNAFVICCVHTISQEVGDSVVAQTSSVGRAEVAQKYQVM